MNKESTMGESTAGQTTQIKLLVNTASEAVNLLRQRYGERARVLSVKQVEAEGLKRLISKPRLEVIVEVPVDLEKGAVAAPKERSPAPSAPKGEGAGSSEVDGKSEAAPAKSGGVSGLYAKSKSSAKDSYFSDFQDSPEKVKTVEQNASPAAEAPLGSAANPVRRGTAEAVRRAISMLEALGLDRSLIERVRSEVDFQNIGALPAMELYARICDWLRGHFPATDAVALAPRRAFIGGCGVGKTSALCKLLSGDVFLRGLTPTVLKIDAELPNPSDGLEVFCEIMGADLARSAEEVGSVSPECPLLVDTPGYVLNDASSIVACREALDELAIEERILVVNSAYESELIAEMMAAGEAIGATRVVFTHLDETRRPGKLWKFLLNGRIKPLFFSEGPNPAGEYACDTYSYLLERTFPSGRELSPNLGSSSASLRAGKLKETSVSS